MYGSRAGSGQRAAGSEKERGIADGYDAMGGGDQRLAGWARRCPLPAARCRLAKELSMPDWAARYSRQAAQMHLTAVSGPSYPKQGEGFISLRSGAPAAECIPREWLQRGMEGAWVAPHDVFGYESAMGA